jgi:16S rRNA (cytosine967-C5)-methyltransferase
MKISPARRAAYEILRKIETEKAFSSVLLPFYEENLEKKDRALCHELVLGVLRRKLYLDKLIEIATKKKTDKLDLEVLVALRLGLYQLLYLSRIPAYSAINESVNLVKFAKKRSAAGLVNAVLRKAARKPFTPEFGSETEKLSVETSHPLWLLEKWAGQFGAPAAKQIAEANNLTPETVFRLTAGFYRLEAEKQREIKLSFEVDVSESTLITDCYHVEHFSDELRALAADGFIYFQDEGSQLVAAAVDLRDGESFFDVCAAPGSKTTYAARNENNPIIAGDFYAHRIETLAANCVRQGVSNVRLIRYDATRRLPLAGESFDAVLIDAPCSGTGTIRSNPEIRYHLREKDFSTLSAKQLAIVENASKVVKKGGRMIYSTCSLEIEENEAVVGRFLRANPRFEKMRPELPPEFITSDGFGRIFPYQYRTDGFFVAALERAD